MSFSVQREEDIELETHYLYSLAVVDFDDVEVETVYSFARRNEVTSLLIKIPSDVHQNLEGGKKKHARQEKKKEEEEEERENAVNSTLVSLSGLA